MAITVLEGTWEDVVERASGFAGRRVRVTVEESPRSDANGAPARHSALGPEERMCLLNRVRAMNVHVPPIGGDAFAREHVYAEDP